MLRTVERQLVAPHAYFAVSATFHYLGPAFAVLLFARVDALGVAWLRIAAAAVVFGLTAQLAGVAFAVANAALFALYIVLGHRVARSDLMRGVDGLALAMLVAAVFVFPVGIWDAAPAFTDPAALAAAIGVGVCSSVIPYVCDQLAMAQLARATYALMVSLFPAIATVIGVAVLTQIPTLVETGGVLLVVAAIAVHKQ